MSSNIKHKLLLKAVNHSDVCFINTSKIHKQKTTNLLSELN